MSRTGRRICLIVGIAALAWMLGCPDDEVAQDDERGSISGQVTLEDAEEHSGVEITAAGESTTTDAAGEYALFPISVGDVEVTADHPEYIGETRTVQVEAREVAEANFELEIDENIVAIESVDVTPQPLVPEQTADVEVVVDNPDDAELSYSYEATAGFEVQQADEPARAELVAPDGFGVLGELTVVVEDDHGASDASTVEVTTREHDDPIIESISVVPEQFEPGETGQLQIEATAPYDDELFYEWTVDAEEDWQLEPTDEPTVELTAPEHPEVSATIEVAVTDELDGETTAQVDVSTRDNNPPEITELNAEPPQVAPGGEIEMNAVAEDPDGGAIDYSWSAPSDWTVTGAEQQQMTLTAPDEYENSATVELEVTDQYGAVATASVIVSTISAQGPRIDAISADSSQVERGGTIELKVEASHPEDADLDYQWTAPEGWELVEFEDAPDQPELVAPNEPAETGSVQVTVTDPENNDAVSSVVVSTLANQMPVVESLDAKPSAVVPGGETTISASAYDPDGEELGYDWDLPEDDGWQVVSEDDDEVVLSAPEDYGESATVTLTVNDGWDSTSATVSVTTLQVVAPNIISFNANPSVVNRGETSTLVVDAEHPYGETLQYDWELPEESEWTLDADEQQPEQAELTAPDTADDEVVVTATVSDDFGQSVEASVTVATPASIPPEIEEVTAEPPQVLPGEEIQLSATATDPDGGGELAYQWEAPSGWTLEDAQSQQTTLTAVDDYGESAEIELVVTDDQGTSSRADVVVSTVTDQGPQIESVSADSALVFRGETVQLEVEATHPQGEPLEYDWTGPEGWELSDEDSSSPQLQTPGEPGETASVEVTVSDPQDNESVGSVVVSTRENQLPTIESLDANPSAVIPGEPTTITAVASDPDGESLTYNWSIPTGWELNGDDDGDEIVLVAPEDYDESATVGLTVDDGWDTTSSSVSVSTVMPVDPNITNFESNPSVVDRNETSQLSVEAEHAYDEPLNYNWELIDNTSGWTLTDKTTATTQLEAPDVAGDEVVVAVTVTDEHEGVAEASMVVSTIPNSPPVIESLDADPYVADREGTVELEVHADDPDDGASLKYDWTITSDDGEEDWTLNDNGTATAGLEAPDAYSNSVTVQVVVEDDHEATASSSVTVQTKENTDPVIVDLSADPVVVDREATTMVEVEAFDPNEEQVNYTWTIAGANESEWEFDPLNEPQLELGAPDIPDDPLEVTITVDDGYGGTTTDSVVVETETNIPPVIEAIELDSSDPDNEWITPDTWGDFTAVIEANQDYDDYVFDWQTTSGWLRGGHDAEPYEEMAVRAPDESAAEGELTLTVSDPWGAEDQMTFPLQSQDIEPDSFGFDNLEDVAIDAWVESEQIELTGFDGPLTAKVSSCDTDCELAVNDEPYTSDEIEDVYPGDELQLRQRSSDETVTGTTVEVTVGATTSDSWEVQTAPWMGERIFTTCGQVGQNGPTQSDCESEYEDTLLEEEIEIIGNGIQEWTVPTTGTFEIRAEGAMGHGDEEGMGAVFQGHIELEAGDELRIVVGQEPTHSLGGGGGSFVTIKDANGDEMFDGENISPLIIAGGGGGTRSTGSHEQDGRMTTWGGCAYESSSCSTEGGEDGEGGGSDSSGNVYGGGGWLTGGAGGSGAGEAFLDGADGGSGGGGFGSAGETRGGGGGYSGGAGGGYGSNNRTAGGGGGFFSADVMNPATSTGEWDTTGTEPHDVYEGSVDDLDAWSENEGQVTIDFVGGN